MAGLPAWIFWGCGRQIIFHLLFRLFIPKPAQSQRTSLHRVFHFHPAAIGQVSFFQRKRKCILFSRPSGVSTAYPIKYKSFYVEPCC